MLAPLLLAVNIVHTGFDGAVLDRAEKVSETHFRCHLRGDVDQDNRNRQANWYYFRIDGAKGREITVDLVNLPGEYNYRPNRGAVTKDTVPVWSDDNVRWQHFAATEYDAAEPRLRLRLTPARDSVWIAHVPPYTGRHLARLIRDCQLSRLARVETLPGTQLQLITITDAIPQRFQRIPEGSKKIVWLMFRQHAWETGSSWAGEGAVRFLLSADPVAQRIRRETIFKIFPLADPDGVRAGRVRFNRFGFDLNRNWDVEDPIRLPEITAQRKAILDWVDSGRRLDLFLSLHNTETSEYLEGPPDREGRYRTLGERFFAALKRHSTFAPTRDLFWAEETTTAGKPGRMTVSQGLYHHRTLPAFLMEQMISRNPRLGRLPTKEDRIAFGEGLVKSVFFTLTSQ